MNSITFVDTEIQPNTGKILDIGSVKDNGSSFHKNSVNSFIAFLKGTEFICGHNIFNHDLKYIQRAVNNAGINPRNTIDTLYLSPLLFPTRPYHALLKDDKLQVEDTNNPLNDSIKAKDLFYDEVSSFNQSEEAIKQIFYSLLKDKKEFCSFFNFIYIMYIFFYRQIKNTLLLKLVYLVLQFNQNFLLKILTSYPAPSVKRGASAR